MSHRSVTTNAHGLTTQSSPSMYQRTPPSTGLWPASGGGSYAAPVDTQVPGPNVCISRTFIPRRCPYHLIPQTQVITLPYTPDGKYRPDLVQAPQLMPPPQGIRRIGSTTTQTLSTHYSPPSRALSTTRYQQQLRPNRSQPNFATAVLPPGARQPAPAVSLDNMRGTVGRAEVQEGVPAPPRRKMNVTFEGPSPPRYERNP
jgi:hypothetical protein